MAEIDDTKQYTREHEWVLVETDEPDIATVGISDYAQSELGDIVHVELPEVGDEIAVSEPFGAVESPKSVSDLYAPVTGRVVEVNDALEEAPETINEDPYGDGWIARIRMTDASELEDLLSAAEYADFLAEDGEH